MLGAAVITPAGGGYKAVLRVLYSFGKSPRPCRGNEIACTRRGGHVPCTAEELGNPKREQGTDDPG